MAYDYQGAIKAGANPTDVMNYMASQTGYKAQQAVQAGANPQDVMGYMATLPSQGTPSPYTINNSSNTNGSTPQTTNDNSLDDISNGIQNLFPNKNIGKVLGTPIGALETAVSDPKDLKNYDWNPHTTAGGVAGDVAGDAINLGSLLISPETGGSSLLARSGVNAAIGGGLSLANSASNGQDIFGKNALENAGGAATLSALLPILGKPFESLENAAKGASGVVEPYKDIIQNSDPSLVSEYINAAKAREAAGGLKAVSPDGLANSYLQKATDGIQSQLKDAGAVLGEARKSLASTVIGTNPTTQNPFTEDILSDFNKMTEDTFQHEITPAEKGASIVIDGKTISDPDIKAPDLKPTTDIPLDISNADKNRILAVHQKLQQFAENPTIENGTVISKNLSNMIDWNQIDKLGVQHDPLQGILQKTRGIISNAIRETSPAIADALDNYSSLKDIEGGIGQYAGKELNQGTTFMRRLIAGDQSQKTLGLIDQIKQRTGIDLTQHAGLAEFAKNNFGGSESQTLLQKEMNQVGSIVSQTKKSLISPVMHAVSSTIIPDTEKYAMRLAGGTSKIDQFVNGNYAGKIDTLLNSPQGRGLLRTYLNNVSAAHPAPGKFMDRNIESLLGRIRNAI